MQYILQIDMRKLTQDIFVFFFNFILQTYRTSIRRYWRGCMGADAGVDAGADAGTGVGMCTAQQNE